MHAYDRSHGVRICSAGICMCAYVCMCVYVCAVTLFEGLCMHMTGHMEYEYAVQVYECVNMYVCVYICVCVHYLKTCTCIWQARWSMNMQCRHMFVCVCICVFYYLRACAYI